MNLAELRGTPAQVKWATAIREASLARPGHYSKEILDELCRINDSTWWIANRDKESNAPMLATNRKSPAPHQLEGGPPPPPKSTSMKEKIQKGITDLEEYAKRNPRPDPTDEPHDAELFAASVSHIPVLAELALDAAMSRLYVKGNQAEVGKVIRHRVRLRLERIREDLIASIDKDIDGIRRILGKD